MNFTSEIGGQKSIGCDLFLDLQMFRVPDSALKRIELGFPQIQIAPINCPGYPLIRPDIEIYWGNRISEEIIASSERLKWIHFGSVGTNNADVPMVRERGILVTNSRDIVNAAMVASGLAHITALARGIHRVFYLRKDGHFSRQKFDQFFNEVQDLDNQTVLILGYGSIGQALARVLKSLGMKIIGVRRSAHTLDSGSERVVGLRESASLIGQADFIVNLLPLSEDTFQIVDSEFFLAMKKSAFFINLGRGETVVESDLIQALKRGAIAGAGLDVFESEPLNPDSPLLQLPNVIVTPHVAGVTQNYWTKETDLFMANLNAYLDEDYSSMLNIVTSAS